MHGKDKVLSPFFEKSLGVTCMVPEKFNTDAFGTFSGEIKRTGSALEAARKKCEAAYALGLADMVVASEGSFGPHPEAPFIHANEELLLFKDFFNNIEISASVLSLKTNFDAAEVNTKKELLQFAQKAGFPSHGVLLKNENIILKDLISEAQLVEAFKELKAAGATVTAETDMHAMRNPTRMKVIEDAAEKLIKNILSNCPKCHWPGYGVTEVVRGLPCGFCMQPTQGVMALIHSCKKCGFSSEEKFPKGKKFEDPMYCEYCNP